MTIKTTKTSSFRLIKSGGNSRRATARNCAMCELGLEVRLCQASVAPEGRDATLKQDTDGTGSPGEVRAASACGIDCPRGSRGRATPCTRNHRSMSMTRGYGRRLPDDQPADPGHADHPRLGRFRHPGSRRVAERGRTTAWPCRCRRRSRRTSRRPSSELPAISVVVQVDAETRRGRVRGRAGLQLCADRPLPGGDRRACARRMGERIAREFIDLETPRFEAVTGAFPDPYALKRVSPEAFAAAILPAVPPPPPGQHADRIAWMAARLRELETQYKSILLVCSILDWPWIRDAYQRQLEPPEPESFFAPIQTFAVDPKTLIFVLGELPFITGLYERGRRELTPDDNLSVDGVKEMVLDARERLRRSTPRSPQRITPQLLSVYFPVRPQPVADRPPADARPVHAGRRRQADGRR